LVGVAGFPRFFLAVAFRFLVERVGFDFDFVATGCAGFPPVVALVVALVAAAFDRSAAGLRRRRRRRFAPAGAAPFARGCFREGSPSATRRF
jgi:hypothetical protein